MMLLRQALPTIALLAALTCPAIAVEAATLRLASPGDAISLDPHASNSSFTNYFLSNIYDGLVSRDRNFNITGQLADRWGRPDATTWRFHIRDGVKFQDGSALTADDVIFSFDRSRAPSSNFKHVLTSVESYRAVDATTVEIKTKTPNPILLNDLLDLMIMSKAWSEKNGASVPMDLSKMGQAAAGLGANGTGPYSVVSRARGDRTVLEASKVYWGDRGNIDKVIFTPIENPSTLVSALLSDQVDLVMPMPIQDVKQIESSPALKVVSGPETRVVFLGMDTDRDELVDSNVKGKNPFKDKRVRQAFKMAIDNRLIVDRIMGGHAVAVDQMVMDKVTGYDPAVPKNKVDVEGAKKLLAEAGFPAGFEVGMDCPINRWINDAEICQATVSMLARAGIKVKLAAIPFTQFYSKIVGPAFNTSFFLMSWTPATMDSVSMFQNVLAKRDPASGEGAWNIGGCSVPKSDALWKRATTTLDDNQRIELLKAAMNASLDAVCTIPLHAQQMVWGARKNIDVVQFPTSEFPIDMMSVN